MHTHPLQTKGCGLVRLWRSITLECIELMIAQLTSPSKYAPLRELGFSQWTHSIISPSTQTWRQDLIMANVWRHSIDGLFIVNWFCFLGDVTRQAGFGGDCVWTLPLICFWRISHGQKKKREVEKFTCSVTFLLSVKECKLILLVTVKPLFSFHCKW